MPKKKANTGRRRFGSPADVRDILRDYHLKNAGIERPTGTYCTKCRCRVFLVQNKEGKQFYVTSVISRQPQGKLCHA